MGKSSGGKQQVSDYYLSLHLAIATRVDEFTGLYVDKKTAWEGVLTTSDHVDILLPNLNGGPKKEGGLVGRMHYLPGAPDQVMPAELAARLGKTPDTCPAFRGLSSVFFTGFADRLGIPATGILGILVGGLLGLGVKGFKWTSNNPVVAQNISARVFRTSKGLNPTLATILESVDVATISHTESDGTVTKTTYVVGTDPGVSTVGGDTTATSTRTIRTTNPAHIIYEVMTDTEQGMGADPGTFNTATFTAAAQTLFNEGLGLSMMWTQQSTIEDFVNEVLSHIQGLLFLDPQTGLWDLKLLRGDYDPATLDVFTPNNATMSNYQKKLWGETINEIAITWTNPVNEASESVSFQDLANIAIQGGIVTDSRNYYGVRTAAQATALAVRDLRSAAAPLRAMDMVVDRSAWKRKPGDVVKVNWPEHRVVNAVMRVGKVDYGKAGDPGIKVSLLEDIFSLEQLPVTGGGGAGSSFTDPSSPPAELDQVQIFTVPAFFALTADLQGSAVTLAYPEVMAGVLGYELDRDTIDYDLQGETTDALGAASFTDVGTKNLVERAVLATALAAEPSSTFPDTIVIAKDRGPDLGGFAFIGNNDSDFEIALVSDFTSGVWTIERGVLDTVPTAWPIGTPIWFVNPGARIVDDKIIRAAGETVDYKMLPRTSQGSLPVASASTITRTLTARPHLPLRPANVKVNGHGFGTFSIGAATTLAITWATRNRTLEEGRAVLWTAGPVAPEYLQETVVTIKDAGGLTVYEQAGLWTENSLSLPVSNFALYAEIFITVSSRREGLASLNSWTLHVTGLANDTGAPVPPAPPPVVDPPIDIAVTRIWAPTMSLNDRQPNASEVVLDCPITFGTRLPAGLTGSSGRCRIAPTSDRVISIYKTGTLVGTITYPAGLSGNDVAVFAMTTATTFAKQIDDLKVQMPASADATFEDFSFQLLGSMTG